MRVSADTLNRGWVSMGWCVSGFLLGAYNNTTHQPYFIVKPCASVQQPCITVGRWGGCNMNTSISVNCAQQQVQKILKHHQHQINAYIIISTPYVTKGTHYLYIHTHATGEPGTCTNHIFSYMYTVLSYIVPGTWYQPVITLSPGTYPW